MKMPAFAKFKIPKEFSDKIYEAIEVAKSSGKVRIGVNETTKCIERGIAKLVVVAEDVTPEEILMHLPVLCKEKKVPFTYVPSKLELGKVSGIEVSTSSIAIEEAGDAKKLIDEISRKMESFSKEAK